MAPKISATADENDVDMRCAIFSPVEHPLEKHSQAVNKALSLAKLNLREVATKNSDFF